MKHNGFIHVVLIFIVMLSFILVGYYLYKYNQKGREYFTQPVNETINLLSSSETDLVDFRDKEFNISFKYPSNWKVNSGINGGEGEGNWWEITIDTGNNFAGFIEEEDNLEMLNSQQWFEKHKNFYNLLATELIQVGVDGQQSLVVGVPDTCTSSPGLVVFIPKGKKILVVTFFINNINKGIDDLKTLLKYFTMSSDGVYSENFVPAFKLPEVSNNIECP
jgi:hypothetical protein